MQPWLSDIKLRLNFLISCQVIINTTNVTGDFMTLIRTIASVLNTIISYLIRVSKWIAMAALAAVMALITINTVVRYIFNSPIRGNEELVEIGMVFIVFLALGYASTQGSDVSVTVIVSKLPSLVKKVLQSLTYFLSLAIAGAISWRGITGGLEMWKAGQETGVLKILVSPFLFVLAFGSAVLCLKLLTDFIKSLRSI